MKKILISLILIVSCTISPVFAAPQESMEVNSIEEYYIENVNKLIQIANTEVGYLEKSSSNSLYEKTANAGSANYTKYARDISSVGFYSGAMNGVPWCDIFVDWCFMQAFGAPTAKEITYQNPYGSAACNSSMTYFKQNNSFFTTPQPGDQIFFTKNGGYSSHHTGIVYKTDKNNVYTIEGNTSAGSQVIANGGEVCLKQYSLSSSRIAGYGRPNYNKVAKKDFSKAQRKKAMLFSNSVDLIFLNFYKNASLNNTF